MKNHGGDHNDQKKNNSRRRQYTQGNQKKHNKRERSFSSTEEREQSNLGKDGVVYMEGRIYIPNNKKIKKEILKENYDLADIRHTGQHRMLELIKRTYW